MIKEKVLAETECELNRTLQAQHTLDMHFSQFILKQRMEI